jgi:hypothetical protein
VSWHEVCLVSPNQLFTTDACSLAYAELFLVIATIVRRFDMELYETPKRNIDLARDLGTPYPEKGNLSVRAVITGVLE